MEKRKCPTCGQEKLMTHHHVLPKRWFSTKASRDFKFELCGDCHTFLEARIIDAEFDNKGVKLSEMKYVKIVIKFLLDKLVDSNTSCVELDNEIVGLLESTRIYFNRTAQKQTK